MKLTDYLVKFLELQDVSNGYGVTGGAACHIFDSLAKSNEIEVIFNHHEQASALAAVSSGKINNNTGLVVVTTGPGGTNTLTGVVAAWQDSVPLIIISGQARSTQLSSLLKGTRQRGLQEFNITELVTPITKYAETILAAETFADSLEKAWKLAHSGRPGPVWIDIPLDLQWQEVTQLPRKVVFEREIATKEQERLELVYSQMLLAKRPIVLIGGGCSSAEASLEAFVRNNQLPFVTTWQGCNVSAKDDNDLYLGRVGVFGQRGANFSIQNADYVLVLGSSLGSCITGNNPEYFAREAKVTVVNIDPDELEHCYIERAEKIQSDVDIFLTKLNYLDNNADRLKPWHTLCLEYKTLNLWDYEELPIYQGSYLNSYAVISKISKASTDGDCFIIDGGGTVLFSGYQVVNLKKNQQLISCTGICAMGTGLPEAIGVATAKKMLEQQVFCFVGDGSFQFNVQELQTIKHLNLNIKIFVINNDGYLAIRHTQEDYFDSNYVGTSKVDLTLPDVKAIAKSYLIPYYNVSVETDVNDILARGFNSKGPEIYEIFVNPKSSIYPVQDKTFNEDGSSNPAPLECMAPSINKDLFRKLMQVKPI